MGGTCPIHHHHHQGLDVATAPGHAQALRKEVASSEKWKSKLFFALREAGTVVEVEVRLHERKSCVTTQPVKVKTPPSSVNSAGDGTMFCASVDLPGNFEPGAAHPSPPPELTPSQLFDYIVACPGFP